MSKIVNRPTFTTVPPLGLLDTFTDGHLYLIEEYNAGVFTRAIQLPGVQGITVSQPTNLDMGYTLGGFPVRDHSGTKGTQITIAGRSGVGYRLGTSRFGVPIFASGHDLFREIKGFFQSYQDTATSMDSFIPYRPWARKRMLFRAVFEQKMYWCEVQNFTWVRQSQTSKFGYEYTLTLAGYATSDGLLGAASGLAKAVQAARKAQKAVDAASALIAKVNQLAKTIQGSISSIVLGPLRAVARYQEQQKEMLATWAQIGGIAPQAVRLSFNIIGKELTNIRTLMSSVPYFQRIDRTTRLSYYEAAAELNRLGRQLAYAFGENSKEFQGADSETEVTSPPALLPGTPFSGPVLPRQLREAETLPALVLAMYGDPSVINIIVQLNNFQDYWTKQDGTPLAPGDTILIPAPPGHGQPKQLVNESYQAYGVDLLLSAKGDLVLNGEAGNATDFVLVDGSQLLEQALTIRLRTYQGEHQVFPDYGLPNMIGDRGVLETAGTLVGQSRQQFLSDKRISSISSITIIDGGDNFELECTLIADGGDTVNAIVPLGVN